MKKAAIVLAAGKGTRMRSGHPKVLHPVAGHPMIRYPLELLRNAGLEQLVLVVGHGADDVRAYVDTLSLSGVKVAHQFEQRGTGHATRIGLEALGPFDGTILLLPGDTPLLRDPTLQSLVDTHASEGAPVSLLTARIDDPSGYGRIVRDGDGRVVRIVEDADANAEQRAINEINTSVYAFDAKFLNNAIGNLGTDNAQGEFYLTDVVAMAAEAGTFAGAVEGPWEELAGINTRAELAAASARLYARIASRHMEEGVTIHAPGTVAIGPDVTLEADAEIGPRVILAGLSHVGSGTRVEAGCVITNSRIGRGNHVKPYCVIDEAEIADNAIVGPFARLRPGAKLADDVHVGNYVEIKKTSLGKGSKANHLTYLGDAEIGAGANIGAGTITCNYDGYAKHKTIIGDGAFIGSNTAVVAPIEVGAGAYVGAGSTITKEVPADSLGVARGRQTNIAQWAANWRARNERK